MNKKGFTMVELLAVLILLGVVAIIAIPTVNRSIKNSREKARVAQEEIILDAAQSYASENTDLLPKKGITLFKVDDLLAMNYIDSSNSENIAESDYASMCVKVRYNSKYNQYQYQIADCSDNINEDCFSYTIEGSGDEKYAKITEYTWDDVDFCPMDVVIPATLGGYDVKYIAPSAFYREGAEPKLSSVDFSLVTELIGIGTNAFKYNNIKEVDLSMLTKIDYVGSAAFENNMIESVEFSDSITEINGAAFAHNYLTTVTLPDNLENMNGNAFYDNSLTGTLDLSNCTKLTRIGSFKSETESTYYIGAFQENNITEVILPNGLVYLGDGTFEGNQIEQITFPNTLKRIGKYAFSQNAIENKTTFPSTLLYIGSYAFYEAYNNGEPDFTSATSLVYIYEQAFFNSFEIDHLDLSSLSSLKTVHGLAFAYSEINTIDMTGMDSLFWLKAAVFRGCGLTGTIDLSDSLELANIGETEDNGATVVYYGTFEDNNISSVILPETDYGIFDKAFYNNPSLTSVDFGNTLRYIGYKTFYNDNLNNIVIPSAYNSSIGLQAFYKSSTSNPNLTTITNNSAYSYDWYNITGQGSTSTCSFKKGTCGTITIN